MDRICGIHQIRQTVMIRTSRAVEVTESVRTSAPVQPDALEASPSVLARIRRAHVVIWKLIEAKFYQRW